MKHQLFYDGKHESVDRVYQIRHPCPVIDQYLIMLSEHKA